MVPPPPVPSPFRLFLLNSWNPFDSPSLQFLPHHGLAPGTKSLKTLVLPSSRRSSACSLSFSPSLQRYPEHGELKSFLRPSSLSCGGFSQQAKPQGLLYSVCTVCLLFPGYNLCFQIWLQLLRRTPDFCDSVGICIMRPANTWVTICYVKQRGIFAPRILHDLFLLRPAF